MITATLPKLLNGQARSPFASMMIKWRKLKKLSQLDLSLESGVSQRHISFMESGRAKPSRSMVLALAQVLDIPLRDQNQLLNVAGFSPEFKERNLDNEEMYAVHHALEMSLAHHEPYPAIVADRNWNLVMENEASLRFLGLIGKPEEVWQRVDPSGNKNVYRLTFHPLGLQPLISNWGEMAKQLLLRLQREVALDPNNDFLSALLNEVIEISGLKDLYGAIDSCSAIAPIIPMEMTAAGITLKTFSMISSFGTAQDVTASELKVETFFPADDVTKLFFERMAV
jgi:transcriptional regulator with XRE-family HTH domain